MVELSLFVLACLTGQIDWLKFFCLEKIVLIFSSRYFIFRFKIWLTGNKCGFPWPPFPIISLKMTVKMALILRFFITCMTPGVRIDAVGQRWPFLWRSRWVSLSHWLYRSSDQWRRTHRGIPWCPQWPLSPPLTLDLYWPPWEPDHHLVEKKERKYLLTLWLIFDHFL